MKPEDSSRHCSHPISLWSVLILSFHLCLGLQSSFFPSRFPTEILYAFLISPTSVTFSVMSSCCHFLPLRSKYSPQHPVLEQSPLPSLSARDKVPHPYKTVGKITVLVFKNYTFLLCSGRVRNLVSQRKDIYYRLREFQNELHQNHFGNWTQIGQVTWCLRAGKCNLKWVLAYCGAEENI
jgi:hypothetical protein